MQRCEMWRTQIRLVFVQHKRNRAACVWFPKFVDGEPRPIWDLLSRRFDR